MTGTEQYIEYEVAMRDGHQLLTRVWLPEGDGPFHVILERGYEAGWAPHPERFTAAEYAYVRARFRKSIHAPPELLEPGRVYEFRIELQPTHQTVFHDTERPSHVGKLNPQGELTSRSRSTRTRAVRIPSRAHRSTRLCIRLCKLFSGGKVGGQSCCAAAPRRVL